MRDFTSFSDISWATCNAKQRCEDVEGMESSHYAGLPTLVSLHGLEPWSIAALVLGASVFTNFTIGTYINWFRLYFTVINGFLNLAILFLHSQAIVVISRLISERMTFGSVIITTSFYRLRGRWKKPKSNTPLGAGEGIWTLIQLNATDFKSVASYQFRHSDIFELFSQAIT